MRFSADVVRKLLFHWRIQYVGALTKWGQFKDNYQVIRRKVRTHLWSLLGLRQLIMSLRRPVFKTSTQHRAYISRAVSFSNNFVYSRWLAYSRFAHYLCL